MDVLIHLDKSTSVYRKHLTQTSMKSTISTLLLLPTFQGKCLLIPHQMSVQHILFSLTPWRQTPHSIHHMPTNYKMVIYIFHKVNKIMENMKTKLQNPCKQTAWQFKRMLAATAASWTTSLPYYPTLTKPIKTILNSHDIKATSCSVGKTQGLL